MTLHEQIVQSLMALNIPFESACYPNYVGNCICDSGSGTGGTAFDCSDLGSCSLTNLGTRNYTDLTGTPTALSAFTNDIITSTATTITFEGVTVKPFECSDLDECSLTDLGTVNYTDLSGLPTLPTDLSDLNNDLITNTVTSITFDGTTVTQFDCSDLEDCSLGNLGTANFSDLNSLPTLIQNGGNVTGTIDLDTGEFALTAPTSTGGTAPVTSVNGDTGVVVLDTSDVAETVDARYMTDAQETKLDAIDTVTSADEGLVPAFGTSPNFYWGTSSSGVGGYFQLPSTDIPRVNIPGPALIANGTQELPSEIDVLTFATNQNLNAGTILTSNAATGGIMTPDNPQFVWFYDGVNVTAIKKHLASIDVGATSLDGGGTQPALQPLTVAGTTPTDTEFTTWFTDNTANNPINSTGTLYYWIGLGTVENPDVIWESVGNATGGTEWMRIKDVVSSSAFAWYDSGIKGIKTYSTGSVTVVENSPGDYSIDATTEKVDRIGYNVFTSGGTQNANLGATIFKITTATGNTSATDMVTPGAKGTDFLTGQVKYINNVLATTNGLLSVAAGNIHTVTLNGFPGAFPDGSKMMINDLVSE